MGSVSLLRQDDPDSGWRVSTLRIWPVRSCGRPCARWSWGGQDSWWDDVPRAVV